jgi:TolA-binding protein
VNEPTRLLDDPNAPEEAASLLRSLSRPVAPSIAKQAALAQQLVSLTSPAGAAAVGKAGTALWVKAVLVGGVLSLGVWGALRLHGHTESPAQPAPAASAAPLAPAAPVALAPEAAHAPALAPLAPATPAEVVNPPLGSAHAKGPVRDNLAEEEALLEQARRAATASPSQALVLLQQYQRRFPGGQLTAERMFLSVDVLTRLGNTSAARKQADALIRAFPTSVYAAQVKGQSSNPGK